MANGGGAQDVQMGVQAARMNVGRALRRWGGRALVPCLLALALPSAAQGVPPAPADIVAVASAGEVLLQWRAPANVAHYELRYASGGGAFGPWTRHGAPSTSATVGGLASGVLYTFQLRAVNAAGPGPSAQATATPLGQPDFVPDFRLRTGPALVYRAGSPVETSLPRAFAATSYAVTPELPDGLSLNALSAVVRGTPTRAQPRSRYTLTAFDDDDDEQTLPFTIEVLEDTMPTFGEDLADQTYRVGSAVAVLQLPMAAGGDGDIVYELTPTLPAGLALDAAGRTISGTPTAVAPRKTFTWTATDEDGDEAALAFSVEVEPDAMPAFGAGVADQTFRVGTAVSLRLPEAAGGDGALSYGLAPALPRGLALDAASRTISGIPRAVAARTTFTWTATDEDGDEAALAFSVEVEPDAMPAFGAGVADQTFRVGTAVSLRLPEAAGGDGALSYGLAPALPRGLALDAASRTIAGTPTAASPRATFTWTATDEDGDEAALAFSVEVEPDAMPAFGAEVADQTYRVGTPVSLRLPEAAGGDGALSYGLAPALPRGLALDAASRTIAGTPTAVSPRATFTWTGTDEDGDEAALAFSIEVEPDAMPTFGGAGVADQRYRVSTAVVDLVLPRATSGDGELVYGLTPALPPGLALDSATRTISGTPTARASRAQYTWTATDEDGDAATLAFAIEVGAAITVSIADASAPEGETLSFPVEISAAVPVPVTVSYRTVDGSARAGEDFAGASGSLVFAPGTTALRIDIAVSSDPMAEADETFTVVLDDVVNAELGDAEATGTIADDDMEAARGEALGTALGAFGRAFVADAVDTVSGRFQEGPPTAPRASSGLGVAVARFLSGQDPRGSAIGGLAGQGAGADAAAAGRPSIGGSAFDSFGSWTGASTGVPGGGSFQMPFGGDAGERGEWTLWAKGATSRVSGEPGFAVDGRIDTGYVGVDARLPRNTLVGIAVSRSTADFDYQRPGVAAGEIELETTTLLPYVHWTLCNGLDLWAMAGAGGGEATLADEFGRTTTDTSVRLAAFGLRHELAATETIGWALKADAVSARFSADALANEIVAADADVERLRLMVEGRREWPRADQARLGASFEFGARLDGGDGGSGVGAELGAAVDYRNMPLGLGLEARGRYLLAHAESDFEDWGLSVALELDPGIQGSGASLRLAPAWGRPDGGVESLWRADRMLNGHTALRRPDQRPARLDMELGYGFAKSKRAGPLRFYGVVGGGSALSSHRLGVRTTSGKGLNWRVEVDRLQRFDGRADHGILFSIGNAPAAFMNAGRHGNGAAGW